VACHCWVQAGPEEGRGCTYRGDHSDRVVYPNVKGRSLSRETERVMRGGRSCALPSETFSSSMVIRGVFLNGGGVTAEVWGRAVNI